MYLLINIHELYQCGSNVIYALAVK